jgi:hypothetical protein
MRQALFVFFGERRCKVICRSIISNDDIEKPQQMMIDEASPSLQGLLWKKTCRTPTNSVPASEALGVKSQESRQLSYTDYHARVTTTTTTC